MDKNTVDIAAVRKEMEGLDRTSLETKIKDLHHESRPAIAEYMRYAVTAQEANIALHQKAISEEFSVAVQKRTLVQAIDARQTPKSLEKALEAIKGTGLVITESFFDPNTMQISLFTHAK